MLAIFLTCGVMWPNWFCPGSGHDYRSTNYESGEEKTRGIKLSLKLKKETMYIKMIGHLESSRSITLAYRLIGLLFLQQLPQFTLHMQRCEGNIFKESKLICYRIDSNLNDTKQGLTERVQVAFHTLMFTRWFTSLEVGWLSGLINMQWLGLCTDGVRWFMASCDPGDVRRLSRSYAADALIKWNNAL